MVRESNTLRGSVFRTTFEQKEDPTDRSLFMSTIGGPPTEQVSVNEGDTFHLDEGQEMTEEQKTTKLTKIEEGIAAMDKKIKAKDEERVKLLGELDSLNEEQEKGVYGKPVA